MFGDPVGLLSRGDHATGTNARLCRFHSIYGHANHGNEERGWAVMHACPGIGVSAMQITANPFRGGARLLAKTPFPSVDAERVAKLIALCPAAAETPLVRAQGLAPVDALWIKDERGRMGLGSFKALGAAYVIAREAAETANGMPDDQTLAGRTYVTASAGNHGMSVAAGARLFGAKAVIFIADTVPEVFAGRLRARSARVIRQGTDYAASMAAAQTASQENGWTLLSDSSWDGYTDIPHVLMEGYLQMAAEAVRQCPEIPTHVLLQAGVGGLAGAVAAYVRKVWGDGLARDADAFLTLTDEEVTSQLPALAESGLDTTASGAAGIAAAMLPEARAALSIDTSSRVMCFLSEIAE